MARIFRKLAQLLDVDVVSTPPADNDSLTYDSASGKWVPEAVSGGAGGGAPTDVDYLVGTASAGLSAEIVVGTSPGGELGGTWASPTVDATHSGSSHASVQAAAEATAAAALSSHASDTTGIHGIADTSALLDTGDIGVTVQAHDADLDTYAGITPSANVQSVLSAADYAAIRSLLGLVIGTNVQAYDADLTTYAGITPSTNVQSLLGAADYAAMRSLLGLVIGTNVQAHDADLDTYASITPSSNVQSILSAADYAAIRTLLGLVIGTNVQAYDAELAALAGLTSAADRLPYFTGSGTAALATFTSAGRALVDDADAATQRTTLDVYSKAEVATELADQKRVIEVLVSDPGGSAITTGDGKAQVRIPSLLNGHNLVSCAASLTTVSSSGTPTIQLRRLRLSSATAQTAADMLTTKITIDASEFDSKDATTAAVIDTSNDDVQTGDQIAIDIDVAGTGAKGLIVTMTFEAP